MVIGIVVIVPIAVRCPGIVIAAAIIRSVIVAVTVIIPIIEFAPAAVMYFHPQVAIVIIGIFLAPVLAIVLLVVIVYIFFPWRHRRIIYIVRCLAAFVSGSAAG